ncbi:MAG: LysR family transcriptional regulator [Methylocella sp.]|nr:MAG: hypothetical protein DLM68_14810 [Hyphomicrobiales bacterium]
MEIRDLRYLDASAKAGNFTRAAKDLRVNPATISRHVGRIEDELGAAFSCAWSSLGLPARR